MPKVMWSPRGPSMAIVMPNRPTEAISEDRFLSLLEDRIDALASKASPQDRSAANNLAMSEGYDLSEVISPGMFLTENSLALKNRLNLTEAGFPIKPLDWTADETEVQEVEEMTFLDLMEDIYQG